jgi:hypothetical protein
MTRLLWARSTTPEMHCVASVQGGTALMYCRHSFATDAWEEMGEQPCEGRRCDECCRVLVDRRFVELGLTELVQATEGQS